MCDAFDKPIITSTTEVIDTASLQEGNVSVNDRMSYKRNSSDSTHLLATENIDAGEVNGNASKKRRRASSSLTCRKNKGKAKSMEEYNVEVAGNHEVNDISGSGGIEENMNSNLPSISTPQKKRKSQNSGYVKSRKRKVKEKKSDEYEVEMIVDYKIEEVD